MNSDERIISPVGHGLQIAGYSTISVRIVFSPEATGDLLFDFGVRRDKAALYQWVRNPPG